MKDTILILDYGSQYTQLIARRVRELRVFSVIYPFNIAMDKVKDIAPKGIILSGGPHSVYEEKAPILNRELVNLGIPILGICYGMQIMVKTLGGQVRRTGKREYGKALMYIDNHSNIFFSLPSKIISWMSHGDSVVRLPSGFIPLAHTENTVFAALGNPKLNLYGVQFHPEVVHTQQGLQIISNFLFRICKCFASWHLKDFVEEKIEDIKKKVKHKNIICALSGGVDSSTVAVLVNRAVGKRLKCIFVDNGLLRKGEAKNLEKVFKEHLKIDLISVDAKRNFLSKLKGVVDPEEKRKIIGHEFIRIFEEEADKIKNVEYLAQGTLYPDVIESVPFFGGPTARIKSHHNVAGLPERMNLKLIEPFRELFKDEVREIAKILGLPQEIILRQPFPGPGLAVRVIGEITTERLKILREADSILERIMKERGFYYKVWQSFCILLPLKSVGVMGDKRTYEYVVVVRVVESLDGMTADWVKLPSDTLEEISNKLINQVKGINRVVFDISSKPPATIEWE
ncbi:MAG: glutamine-hydrolyzing GMP synthase [Candidatus Omnitrophica bacterium]|nr:glutamine-hydrolyzing GMP synthase [Candidatus Omnitrophota bacterium]MCM8827228.1 glutamine-hydrolyzing GMP synthase [Candidatus Omnitrophota bacterium]